MQAIETFRFRVCAGHIERHHARVLSEKSFEAAAVSYLESCPPAPGETSEMVVLVRDLAHGHERCFRINLDTGEAALCA